jgi:hypothetical protein
MLSWQCFVYSVVYSPIPFGSFCFFVAPCSALPRTVAFELTFPISVPPSVVPSFAALLALILRAISSWAGVQIAEIWLPCALSLLDDCSGACIGCIGGIETTDRLGYFCRELPDKSWESKIGTFLNLVYLDNSRPLSLRSLQCYILAPWHFSAPEYTQISYFRLPTLFYPF